MGAWTLGLLLFLDAPSSRACVELAATSYLAPGEPWSRLLELRDLRQVVLNPANGAGPALDPDYAEVVRDAHTADVRVLGYLPTRYGTRDAMEVLAEAEDYVAWYGVDGFFVDETTSGPPGVDYYAGLVGALRERGAETIALNPGAVPDERYMWIGDQVVVFEGPAAEYSQLSMPPWASKYAPERFWSVVYGLDIEAGPNPVVLHSIANRIGLLWVTDDAGGNPYDTVPDAVRLDVGRCETGADAVRVGPT